MHLSCPLYRGCPYLRGSVGLACTYVCAYVPVCSCSIEPKKTGGGTKRQLVLETSVDPGEHGTVVDMTTFSTGGEEVVCYATSMGMLAGLDLRSGKLAWELNNSAKFGTGRDRQKFWCSNNFGDVLYKF